MALDPNGAGGAPLDLQAIMAALAGQAQGVAIPSAGAMTGGVAGNGGYGGGVMHHPAQYLGPPIQAGAGGASGPAFLGPPQPQPTMPKLDPSAVARAYHRAARQFHASGRPSFSRRRRLPE